MSQEEDAAKAAIVALYNVLEESSFADDVDLIVDKHEHWIEESKEALWELDLYLSGESRRFGFCDEGDLRSLFLCGDDFVAIMNGGFMHLTTTPSPNGPLIKFRPRTVFGRCAWEDLFRR